MSSDIEFEDADFGAEAFDELDQIELAYASGAALPPRSIVNKPGLAQRDLFGGVVQKKEAPPPKAGPSRTNTGGSAGSGAGETRAKVRLSKHWDPASFAKHGWSKKNAAVAKAKAKGKSGKGKQRAYGSDEEPWDEEEVLEESDDDEDDGFLIDTTYDPNVPIPPIKWPPDEEAIKTFIYPVQPDKPLRNYQYNIVIKALYENTLVSLPTGLGKTFIAAVIMLNFYRWYPRGKVLFLAPTRPLVTQQIKACHYIAGIPQHDCVELTGSTIPKLRSVGWATKRVIYSTPQTVERDLAKGRLDPRDVTCIVIDEAHRASGDYSYCGVVRYMMSRNPHFRILALTATPGAKGDAVQNVIDNLHIGRIEVRADDSLDIRQYVHKKSFDLCVLPLGPQLAKLRDKWADLMKQYIQPLYAAKLIWSPDATTLAPFAVQQAYGKMKGLPGGTSGANGKFFPMIKTLGMMARAMEYLVIQSVTQFESNLKDIEQNASKNFVASSGFREILKETSQLRSRAGYVGHPKMEKLRSMCLDHFQNAQNEVDDFTGEKRETRVMIFCNFRAVVEEIVACLNTQRPLIKATPFVGQASSKGVKGKSQKEQLATIKKFKEGVYNVLVATSIGEEGLDIGEIDLIVCYEANKSPIRMLQRVGRTGRARDGHIIVLMSEGREEKNWDKANDAYAEVQNALTSNKIFELYVDGERLLPADCKPACEQVQIKALPMNMDAVTMNGQSRAERKALAEKKPKRKFDVNANAPADAFMGFRAAGALAAASKIKIDPVELLKQRKADALLTVEEEGYLRTRWQQDERGRAIRPQRFDLEELPFERGSTGSALTITHHSERHNDLLIALRTCQKLSEDGDGYEVWHEKHSKAFNPKLVEIFRSGHDDRPKKQHVRLRRPPSSSPEPEDFPLLTFPMTGFVATSSSAVARSQPAVAKDDDPLDLFSDLSQLPRAPSPPSRRSPSPALPPRQRSISPPAQVPPPRPPSSTKSEVVDLSMLDSDDEEVEVAPVPPLASAVAPPPPPRPSSAAGDVTFDFDDGDDLYISDSELLRGASIHGNSVSPPKAKLEKEKEQEEIVLDDSEDDVAPMVSRPPSRPISRPPSRPVSRPLSNPPSRTLSQHSNGERKAGSSPPSSGGAKPAVVAFRPFQPPRPSAEKPIVNPSSKPIPAVKAAPPPLPRAEPPPSSDEYSFFDLADEDIEACLADIPQAAIRGASKQPHQPVVEVEDEEDDDLLIMPPPPVPAASTSRPSSCAKMGFRPASAVAAEQGGSSAASSGQSVPLRKAAPMRRLAIADSSSPVVGAGGPRRRASSADVVDEEGNLSLSQPKQLNRLRRARQASPPPSDDDGVLVSSSPPVAKKAKKNRDDKSRKKKKKPILTHKAAAKFGIFDMEAINSSAGEEGEASSEDYASEDSDDRNFVADETFEELSPDRMQAFYRESLASQAPPGFGTPGGPRRFGGPERRPVPITPATQDSDADDWDYGSFVVPDGEEELEMGTSSPDL